MKYSVEVLRVGQLQTNCYLIYASNHALVVDPGDDTEYILNTVQRLDIKISTIISTHGHFDHVLSVGELQQALKIPFFMHSADQFLLERLSDTATHFLRYPVVVLQPKISTDLALKKCIPGFEDIEIVTLPGHTPGSLGFFIRNQNLLFSGDTLFKSGIGRTDFSYSSKIMIEHSLQKLAQMNPKVRVLPGHGEETTIGQELGYNDHGGIV